MKANEALRNWIKNMVDKNKSYECAAGDVNVDEEAGAIDVEDDVIEDIVDEMDLVPVKEEMALSPSLIQLWQRPRHARNNTLPKPTLNPSPTRPKTSMLLAPCEHNVLGK